MTRGRKKPDVELTRELVEADLAALGNAVVYLRLVVERLGVLSLRGMGSLVDPGIEDLGQAERLIRAVQRRIGERAQCGACLTARASGKKKQ